MTYPFIYNVYKKNFTFNRLDSIFNSRYYFDYCFKNNIYQKISNINPLRKYWFYFFVKNEFVKNYSFSEVNL